MPRLKRNASTGRIQVYKTPQENEWARGGESGLWLDLGKIDGRRLPYENPGCHSRASLCKPWTAAEYRAEAKRLGYPSPI